MKTTMKAVHMRTFTSKKWVTTKNDLHAAALNCAQVVKSPSHECYKGTSTFQRLAVNHMEWESHQITNKIVRCVVGSSANHRTGLAFWFPVSRYALAFQTCLHSKAIETQPMRKELRQETQIHVAIHCGVTQAQQQITRQH